MAKHLSLHLLILLLLHATTSMAVHHIETGANELSFTYYAKSCPTMEAVVHNKVAKWIKTDPTLSPAIIRLHFHDCAIRVTLS